jgi:hypothetical protein
MRTEAFDMRHLVAFLVSIVVVASSAACGAAVTVSPSPTANRPSPTPTAERSIPAPASASVPVDGFAAADAICRDELSVIWKDLSVLVTQKTAAGVVGILYADSDSISSGFKAWDHICIWDPKWAAMPGRPLPLVEGEERLAPKVSATQPIVMPGVYHGGTGETNYLWGAVTQDVARVAIEIADRTGKTVVATREATLANGYFLALLGPELPCCLWTIVAFDAGGGELARRRP